MNLHAMAHVCWSMTTSLYIRDLGSDLIESALPAESACWPSTWHLLKEPLVDCSIVCLRENLKGGKDSSYDIPNMRLKSCSSNRDLDSPGKAQNHVFYDGAVVVGLGTQTNSRLSSHRLTVYRLLRLYMSQHRLKRNVT